jgi:hypothetical protein
MSIAALIRATDRTAETERAEWTGENATPTARFQGATIADRVMRFFHFWRA